MRPLVVLNVAGLTPALLPHAPRLAALAREGFRAELQPVLPAVTCPAQSSMLTGLPVSGHGVVANGWLGFPLLLSIGELSTRVGAIAMGVIGLLMFITG